MRSWEFYNVNPPNSALDVDSSRRPRITLRHLNRLKERRKRRQQERAAKIPFFSRMYGDWEQQELDALSQQISSLSEQGATAEDVDAAKRALRKMANRMEG